MNGQIEDVFVKAGGKAVDFPEPDYQSRKAVFDTIAATHGYRLAGFRLQRAVFSSKAEKGDET